MTDWERVEKLRSRGRTWSEIAEDDRVGFVAPSRSDPGLALQVLYRKRRASHAGENRPKARSAGRTWAGDLSELTRPGRRRKMVSWAVGLGLATAVTSLVVFLLITPIPGTNVVTFCGGEGTAAHYHPLLIIDVNGVQQHLPYDASQGADIGFINDPAFTNPSLYCPSGGIHALHTHDGSGIIHAELPTGVKTTPTLGNFFTIWGQPLSSTQVWSYSGTVSAKVTDSNTGGTTDYSSSPSTIPLYTPPGGGFSNPFSIPQNLIFNGAYGSGESGGTFDGEIIWLNVTTSGAGAAAMTCNCSLMAMVAPRLSPSEERGFEAPASHWSAPAATEGRERFRAANGTGWSDEP